MRSAVAAIGPDRVQQKRRENEHEPRARPDRLGASGRNAVLAAEFEARRVHHRGRAARVEHLELAAERGIVGAAAVVDVVRARPEGAGVIMAGVGVAGAVDIGPGLHGPVGLDGRAVAVAGQFGRDQPGERENLLAAFAAPAREIPRRMPAADIGGAEGRIVGAIAQDDLFKLGVAGRRVGNHQGGDGGGEQPPDLNLPHARLRPFQRCLATRAF